MAVDIVIFKGEKADLAYSEVLEVKILELKQVRGKSSELIIVEARDSDEVRKVSENKNVDIIYRVESSTRRDNVHFRESGLNQATLQFCKKNNIAIAIPIAEIINSHKRNRLIGRVMQNIRFCRKYKVRMVAASFATKKEDQRSASDIESFLRTLGMTPKEAKESLTNVQEILKDKREIVKKGVRIKN